jgi:hypothetical protein
VLPKAHKPQSGPRFPNRTWLFRPEGENYKRKCEICKKPVGWRVEIAISLVCKALGNANSQAKDTYSKAIHKTQIREDLVMKKTALLIACAGLIIGGIGLAAPEKADAGIRISFGSGHYGHGHGHYRGYGNYYGGGFYSNSFYSRPSYGGYYGGGYYGGGHYNYPHYDYHPTTIVPHGNHYHVIPGHYHYHYGHHH